MMNAPLHPMPQQPTTTPSSEILHLVSSFTDTVDAIPPSIARSLSDLKELDAVLSGALQNITKKIQRLLEMMYENKEDGQGIKSTPIERLNLLREVTEDARVFRLGGEDKIRVATGTCETIATHTSHLATLSTLLLNFLPTHLLPQLPPPTATHGYPSTVSPLSIIAKRQNFDYNTFLLHPSVGSTGRGLSAKNFGIHGGGKNGAGETAREREMREKLERERERSSLLVRKKTGHLANGNREETKTTKRREKERVVVDKDDHYAAATNGNGFSQVNGYSGMATQEEYNAAMGLGGTSSAPGGGGKKRKVEDGAGQSKRRKKTSLDVPADGSPLAHSPLLNSNSTTPVPVGSTSTTKRRKPEPISHAIVEEEEPLSALEFGGGRVEGGEAEGEEADGNIYCFCAGSGFGDMIGCDSSDCETEWFHLNCVGMQDAPKGKWFCDDCKKRNTEKGKKRR